MGGSITVSQFICQASPVSLHQNSLRHVSNLGKTHWGFGSRAFVGIVITDSVLEAGGSSPSVGGSAVVVPVVKVSMGCALGLGAQCL